MPNRIVLGRQCRAESRDEAENDHPVQPAQCDEVRRVLDSQPDLSIAARSRDCKDQPSRLRPEWMNFAPRDPEASAFLEVFGRFEPQPRRENHSLSTRAANPREETSGAGLPYYRPARRIHDRCKSRSADGRQCITCASKSVTDPWAAGVARELSECFRSFL